MYACITFCLHLTLGSRAMNSAQLGEGISSQILLDNVDCTGSEERLIDCPANPVGSHDCSHLEDAGVTCSLTRMFSKHACTLKEKCLLFSLRVHALAITAGHAQ